MKREEDERAGLRRWNESAEMGESIVPLRILELVWQRGDQI